MVSRDPSGSVNEAYPHAMAKRSTLISLALMTDLFNVAPQTVYRWNTASGDRPKMLPEPDLHVGRTPLWDEHTILTWANERGMKVNEIALASIRRDQEPVKV